MLNVLAPSKFGQDAYCPCHLAAAKLHVACFFSDLRFCIDYITFTTMPNLALCMPRPSSHLAIDVPQVFLMGACKAYSVFGAPIGLVKDISCPSGAIYPRLANDPATFVELKAKEAKISCIILFSMLGYCVQAIMRGRAVLGIPHC